MSLDLDIRHRQADFALDVAFSAPSAGITALFGPSGAGKSTVVNAVAGLLRPEAGTIRIDGHSVVDTAAGTFVPARRRRIGYVFQDARLFPHMSVAGNLAFGWRRAAERLGQDAWDEVIELLGVGPLMARRPTALSGGERQRVALGRALLANPSILLLDEPLAALDAGRKSEILPYLERLRDDQRVPIVYVSHSIDEVTRLADEIVVLNRGRVAAQGSVFDIMARLDLFPMTGRFEAGAVIDAAIAEHDRADKLTAVAFDGGRLWVPMIDAPEGARIRLRVRARDVMLATGRPDGISANNVIEGVVSDLRPDEGAYVDVQVACGETRLIARITHRSLRRLGLVPGAAVHAVIKSITVDRRAIVETGRSRDSGGG